jgi:hypothetical protein
MPKLIPEEPASLKASVAPVPASPVKPPPGSLRRITGMVIGTVLVPVLLILGVVSNAWMPSWGAASVAIVFGLGACFLLVRKIGSGGRRASAVIFALGSGLGVVSAVGQADRAREPKPREMASAAPVKAAPEPEAAPEVVAVEAAPEPEAGEALPEPEVLSPEARERRAKVSCIGAAQDNYSGVDWKFFQNTSFEPSADAMKVTLEGKRENQPYRLVCQVPDGYEPTTSTLYRVDIKSKKLSVERETLSPCTTAEWTAASVCRPARPVSGTPVVNPGKRLDEAQDQCRLIARSTYPGIEWRTIMGIGSEWFELLGVHGVRTAIDGSRSGQGFRIICFKPDGATEPGHKLYSLHPITGEPTEVVL